MEGGFPEPLAHSWGCCGDGVMKIVEQRLVAEVEAVRDDANQRTEVRLKDLVDVKDWKVRNT